MIKYLNHTTALWALIASNGLIIAPAFAEANSDATVAQSERGFGEIVVTARRVDESLQNVPLAISVATSEALERANVVKMEDLQKIAPGLAISSTIRGSATPAYAIRGLRTFDVSTASDPSVTMYFDDYGVTRNTGSNQLMFDLQSVQVLKGPQGTLFGRNTTGGAILVTPNAPTDELDGYIKGTIGSYSQRDLEGVLNVPLTDGVALRVAGKYSKRNGYLTNAITGEDLNDVDAFGARAALAFEMGANVKSTFIGMYFKNNSNGTATKIDRVVAANTPVSSVSGPILTAELAATNMLGRYEFRSNVADFFSKDTVAGIQNKTEWDINDNLTLKNIVGYRSIKSNYFIDTDGSNVQAIDFPGFIDSEQFSEELQLQGKVGIFDFVTGVFYFEEQSLDQTNSSQFTYLTPPGRPFAPVLQDFEAENQSLAAFAHTNVDASGLVEGLSLSAGFRFTKDIRKITPRTRNPVFNTTINVYQYQCAITGVVNDSADRNLCGAEGRSVFKEPTWNVSLNYQINSGSLVYLAHRHGYKAGGINPRPTNVTGFVAYDPEKVNDIELGIKSDFTLGNMDGRLNVAAYHTWLSGAQRNQNVIRIIGGAPSTTSLITNAASAKIKGAEVEFLLRPFEGMDLSFSYAYTDPKYSNWIDSPIIGGVVTPIDVSDSEFAFIPKHQLSASARYELPLPESAGKLSLQASAYYQSKVFSADINTTNCGPGGAYTQCANNAAQIAGYTLVNLRADWERPFEMPIDVSIFVENVTNKYYENFGYALLQTGISSVGIGAPRMFGASVRVPFGASAY